MVESNIKIDALNLLTKKQMEYLLITALEGGVGYWDYITLPDGLREKYKTEERPALAEYVFDAIMAGETISIHDAEDTSDKLGDLNIDALAQANSKLYSDYPEHFSSVLNETYDAETADVWFQLGVMGELTFG